MADKIQFFETDPDVIALALKTKYESLTSRPVQPAQSEQLVFNAIAYRLSLSMIQANETANKCLAAFATGTALEYLGELVGVRRLAPAPAACTIRFQLVAGHGPLNVPSGLRVQTIDGQAVFITTQSKNVDWADTYVDVSAECTTEGIVGNDYAIGQVSVILDPQAYLTSAANLDITANGSDQETDEELRERILLAPSQFSVAGPTNAYKFFAKSAHPNIVDVAVTTGHDLSNNPVPGQVDIFPLMADGNAPSSDIMDAVYAICNDEKVRPLTDTPVVKAPTNINYAIEVELTLLSHAVQGDVVDAVTANLEAYRDDRKQRLGIDVVKSQIIGKCQVEGVYNVNVVSPASDIVAEANEHTTCTGINVTVVGTSDE